MKNVKSSTIKKITKTVFFISVLFNTTFIFWYTTDFKITRWGNIDLTTSSFVESYYWTKRDIFWSKLLDHIANTKNQNLQTFLLERYTELIPVNQWWFPLRNQKTRSMDLLLGKYRDKKGWESLEKLSREYTEINPNLATGWFNLGLAHESQSETDKAIKSYNESLKREVTHLETVQRLSSMYLKRGDYYNLKRILSPYLHRIQEPESLCFYWGTNSFDPTQLSCANRIDKSNFLIPIEVSDTVNMVRIDPPQGNFTINSIQFVNRGQGLISDSDNFSDFSQWIASKNTTRNNDNSFHSTGPDPYVYTKVTSLINLKNYSHVLVNIDLKLLEYDPSLESVIVSLGQKTNL